MRTVMQILTVCGLMAGMVCAQEKNDSVQSVMNELNAYQGVKPAAPVAEPAPAVAITAPVVEKPAAPVDVPAVVEQSRKQYVAGDCDQAEKGFYAVLEADPGNPIAAFYLSRLAGLRHRDTEETVLQKAAQEWGIILRSYPATDLFVESMNLEGVKQVMDVKPQLMEAEIEFPAGSSARYVPDFRKLFVKNTPANLEKLEKVLAAFGVAEVEASAEQVKIETRFVEFNEGALQELGFNWSNPNAINRGDWSLPSTIGLDADGNPIPQTLFSGALRTLPYDQTKNLGLGEVSSREGNNRIDNYNVNRIADTFNSQATGAGTVSLSGSAFGESVDLLIKALDQTSGADVLSAPSIVTRSGEPATITVGERHFYPETYEAGESQGTVLHVKYADFREKILGVEMTVTPTIKGNEIQMKINPKINELLGWQQFELSPADTSYTYYQYRVGMQFEHESVVAQLPLFNRREVKTEISVASGSTVGMGGLIGEKTEAFSDRVPVLGSIPLIGRLFRSEGSRTVKRNLMIFVTASKVAPNGRIISERSFEK
ncbi:MAG: type II and III secretion system protein [Kiritimatiellales bacterium]